MSRKWREQIKALFISGKPFLTVFCALLIFGSCTQTGRSITGTGDASLKLNKNTVSPGEKITVYFTASPGFKSDAWKGITVLIPKPVPIKGKKNTRPTK